MTTRTYIRLFVCFIAAALVLTSSAGAVFTPPSGANLTDAANSFVLRPGVVVDPVRAALYVMTPDNRVAAIDIASGDERWATEAAAQPLGLYGNYLVALVEPTEVSAAEVAFLDLANGDREVAIPLTFPERTAVSIDDGPNRRFDAKVQVVGGEVYFHWTYTSYPLHGAPVVDRPAPTLLDGVFRLDPLTRAATVPVAPPKTPAALVPDLAPAERLTGVEGRQFRAANERHVLASEQHNDDPWNRYQWTLVDRASGLELGRLDQSRSMAPFFVSGSTLVFEALPHVRRLPSGELASQQLAVQAVDVGTGRELWQVAVRDTTYRGPLAP
ncbi:MAG: PQQ-binding-like beta-propeller repeat protein [Acidobacteriota bacterium]